MTPWRKWQHFLINKWAQADQEFYLVLPASAQQRESKQRFYSNIWLEGASKKGPLPLPLCPPGTYSNHHQVPV